VYSIAYLVGELSVALQMLSVTRCPLSSSLCLPIRFAGVGLRVFVADRAWLGVPVSLNRPSAFLNIQDD